MKKFFKALAFAWRAFRFYLRFGDLVSLTVAESERGNGAKTEKKRFVVEIWTRNTNGFVYKGNDGVQVRRVIERIKKNDKIQRWVAYRNGVKWDWGPRT